MFTVTGRARPLYPAALVEDRLREAFPAGRRGGEEFEATGRGPVPLHVRAAVSPGVPPRVDYRIESGNGTLGLMLVLIACVPALVAGLFALLGGPLPAPAGLVAALVFALSAAYAGMVALALAVRVRLAERRLLAVVGAR
jgi:hypothetical protein